MADVIDQPLKKQGEQAMGTTDFSMIHHIHDAYTRNKTRSFAFIGINPGAGVTYCCTKIAAEASLLLSDLTILLVDMNIHNQTISKKIGNPDTGWIPWITKKTELRIEDIVVPMPNNEHLHLLPTGDISAYNSLALKTETYNVLKNKLMERFDIIMIDTPGYYKGIEAHFTCSAADGIILVVEAEVTRRPLLKQMLEELQPLRDSVLGVIFNKRQFHIPYWLYNKFF